MIFLVYKLECSIIKISTEWILRCWQYKHNYIDTYLHTYVLTFVQPHKNKVKCKQNKTEWLLQQNHRADGMIEAPNGRMDTAHRGCC